MAEKRSAVPQTDKSDEVLTAGASQVEESASKAAQQAIEHDTTEEEVAKKMKQRTWLVKAPKPLDVSAPASVDHLVAELTTYKNQAKLLGESADVIKIGREHARDNLRKASDSLKDTWRQIKDKEAIAKPLREERDKTKNSKSQFKQRFEGLHVRTGAELDEKVKELEHRQMHETLSIREEKEIIKQIKALKSQRGLLVEYEAENNQQQHSKQSLDKILAELKELDIEINALYQEKEVQDKIVESYREEEKALNAEVEKLLDERKRVRGLQDKVWNQLREEEKKTKAATEPYYAGRRFAVRVREIIQAGRVEEAREMCNRQVDEMMAKLSEDDEYRKQYLHAWSLIRSAVEEDINVDSAPSTSAPPPKLSKEEKEVQNKRKAASLIAAALQHAQEEMQERRAAIERKAAKEKQPPQPTSSRGLTTAEAAPEAPAAEEAAKPSAPADKPKPKPKPKKAPKATVVELPKLDERPFVPPAAAVRSTPALTDEELREKEREHNKAAALEAAQRKERRKQAADRKRQQKAQQKEQAKEPTVAAASAEEVTAPETPPAEEDGYKLDHSIDAAAAQLEAAVEEAPKLRARTVKAHGPKSGLGKIPAQTVPKPKARPSTRKRGFLGTLRSYGQTAYSTYEEHPLVVGGVSAVLGLLAVAAPAVYLFT